MSPVLSLAFRRSCWLHGLEHAIPKAQSGLQRLDGGSLSSLPILLVLATEPRHQLSGHGAMVVSVEFDMTAQIEFEIVETTCGLHVQLVDDLPEHPWQQILSPKGERCGDRAELTAVDDLEGRQHKLLDAGSSTAGGKGRFNVVPSPKLFKESLDACCVGPRSLHSPIVEVKMAGKSPLTVFVAFLSKYDLVDESSSLTIFWR